MRASEAFVLGAITGAAVAWLWGREMKEYAEEKTREPRTKIAEGVRAVEENTGNVLDRGGDLLRRVDEFVRDTKEDVSGQGGKRFARYQRLEKDDQARSRTLPALPPDGSCRLASLKSTDDRACIPRASTTRC